ncbi:MAG: hypothetical protein O7G87_19765 [bacterium]|nr:hypothetical protein [bacterium]
MAIELDGVSFGPTMARTFLEPGGKVDCRISVEMYVSGIDPGRVRAEDLAAKLWTDINALGTVNKEGAYQADPGVDIPMDLVTDACGCPCLRGNNLVFESPLLTLTQTGVFHYTTAFSADGSNDASKDWVLLNDIAHNQDGLIAVSPDWVRGCPSVTELCVRKVGASVQNGRFVSGTFRAAMNVLEDVPTDVVYLLPFFEPGYKDLYTGEDVRKGKLGSPYAVKDFFRLDPHLVSPLSTVDLSELVMGGWIRDKDLQDLLPPQLQSRFGRDLERLEDWIAQVGQDVLTQIVGRAELRMLIQRAHDLDKRVIFDLVLMQTSRDCPLIQSHPEWYMLDDLGQPKIHQIAWLVYSDVALLDLPFNLRLQDFLSRIAPFWIQTCDLDGVRIDASQTVDRPFLKQLINRIHQVKPDALVLGETLCELQEAVDIPTDMIYALLVDFHRDVDHAEPYISFLEHTFGTFAPRTVAVAYFENHDSVRATRIWRERFVGWLEADGGLKTRWQKLAGQADLDLVMALLKNLQCSLINVTVGTAGHVNMAYALEWGTTWGEETETDFENPTLLHPEHRHGPIRGALVRAYTCLYDLNQDLPELREGHIYFHRNSFDGGDPEDRVFAYTRHRADSALLVVHNLDPKMEREVRPTLQLLGVGIEAVDLEPVFDSYSFFGLRETAEILYSEGGLSVRLGPLQSIIIRMKLKPLSTLEASGCQDK